MTAHILIIVDDNGFEVWQRQRRNICLRLQTDGHAEPAQQALESWIKQHATHLPCAILIENADERLVLDHLPRCGRNDRLTLLARRLAQQFPATPYVTHFPQPSPHDPTNRETILLAGLGTTDVLAALIAIIDRFNLPIARIVTPTLLLQTPSLRTANPEQHELLLCFDGAAMQIVLTSHGALRFTRQSRGRATLLADSLPDHVQTLAQTCAYLVGQRLLDTRQAPRARVIAATKDHTTLAALADAGIEITLVNPRSLMRPLPALAPDAAQSETRALMVQLLAEHSKTGYLPGALRHRYPLWRSARLAIAAGTISLIAATGLSAARLADANLQASQSAQLETRIDDTHRQVAALTEAEQRNTVPSHATIALARALHEHQQLEISSGSVMHHLSMLLADAPSLRLQRLAWHPTATETATRSSPPPLPTDITVYASIRAEDTAEAATSALEAAIARWQARSGHQLDWQWQPSGAKALTVPTNMPVLDIKLTIARDMLTQPTDKVQP
ncbi:hypothetical protein [Parazoarcus communis]|uniref:GspL cytoplasmic actin-ATPase-like domain-containing protein n=1 Tax=Parazoarcus communis SWub3 = DSM 12120 TaxID=1121029 RepID=A0A323V1U0_9RHOO|nr:hypothetical protein [Parazoarcus communis]NMG69517.1 hypothetical protein [Parazoarcus communis SWub3 = DSM 12120]PZA17456.1 hypothetical protein DNK49_06235 [Azoarcus communis] [Parazoarcus communis SWub3 = DSM 12120]